MDNFLNWLKINNIDTSKFEIINTNNQRKIIAKDNINADTIIFSISSNNTLNLDNELNKSSMTYYIKNSDLHLNRKITSLLSLHLAEEINNSQSDLKPYYDILPNIAL